MEQSNKTLLGIGIFLTIASALLIVDITPEDKIYSCEDRDLVGFCFKLSNVNDAGISTRCYYNETAPTKYKTCSSGWEIFTTGVLELNNTEVDPGLIPGPVAVSQERCSADGCVPI